MYIIRVHNKAYQHSLYSVSRFVSTVKIASLSDRYSVKCIVIALVILTVEGVLYLLITKKSC